MTYGSDFAGVDDIDFNLTFLEGEAPETLGLVQAIARRFLCQRGGLFYADDYGMDLRSFVADSVPLDIAQGLIGAEARKDERVTLATCEITLDVKGAWIVVISVVGSQDETFTLTFLVTPDNVQQIVNQ